MICQNCNTTTKIREKKYNGYNFLNVFVNIFLKENLCVEILSLYPKYMQKPESKK